MVGDDMLAVTTMMVVMMVEVEVEVEMEVMMSDDE